MNTWFPFTLGLICSVAGKNVSEVKVINSISFMNFKMSQELGVRLADFPGRINFTSEKLMDLHTESQFS